MQAGVDYVATQLKYKSIVVIASDTGYIQGIYPYNTKLYDKYILPGQSSPKNKCHINDLSMAGWRLISVVPRENLYRLQDVGVSCFMEMQIND